MRILMSPHEFFQSHRLYQLTWQMLQKRWKAVNANAFVVSSELGEWKQLLLFDYSPHSLAAGATDADDTRCLIRYLQGVLYLDCWITHRFIWGRADSLCSWMLWRLLKWSDMETVKRSVYVKCVPQFFLLPWLGLLCSPVNSVMLNNLWFTVS